MDCETFHLELPDLIYGELDAGRKSAGEAHVADCTSCAELLTDLQTVRTAAPNPRPPALLNSRIKLAARDALLGEAGEPTPPAPITARGGPLHTATTLILAACVCLAGFGLGIYYERTHPRGPGPDAQANPPKTFVPRPPPDDAPLVRQDQEPWLVEITPEQGKPIRLDLDSSSEEWQRVLVELGHGHLRRKDYGQAREVFARAITTAPQGPLVAAAEVGICEALLREGAKSAALEKLETIRQSIRAETIQGDEALLQRVHELIEEASPPG